MENQLDPVSFLMYQFVLLYNVLVEPEIIGLPSDLVATEGQSFTFPSHVTGKPEPDVYWYLNSKYVCVGVCSALKGI